MVKNHFKNFFFFFLVRKPSFKPPHIQPPGTEEYTVDKNDTIERIALKYNTIPSDIQYLNRLSSRMLFPGQKLFVPDPTYVPSTPLKPTSPSIDRLSDVKTRNNSSPKPGHIDCSHTISEKTTTKTGSSKNLLKQQTLRHMLTEGEAKELDEECMQRFSKLDSKLISYEKNVAIDGVLLISPAALMFDPKNVDQNAINSDRSVSLAASLDTNSVDNESIIIHVEIISNVVLYEDLSIGDVGNYIKKKK
jgi:LysM repeat protein